MGVSWLFLVILVFSVLALAIFSVSVKLGGREKLSIFECGFDVISSLRLPFSLHFYFVSIIFLVFDVEVILILPLIYIFKVSVFFSVCCFFFFFFFVLMVGFFYEWRVGFLFWII